MREPPQWQLFHGGGHTIPLVINKGFFVAIAICEFRALFVKQALKPDTFWYMLHIQNPVAIQFSDLRLTAKSCDKN